MSSIYPPSTPEIARRRPDLAPNQQAGFEAFGKAVFANGALSAKIKQIISVAVAHVTQCQYCINGHTKAALRTGATPEELMEAIWVAAEMRAGGAYAHSTLTLATLAEDEDKRKLGPLIAPLPCQGDHSLSAGRLPVMQNSSASNTGTSSYQVKNIALVMAGSDMRARLFTLAPGDVIPWHYYREAPDHYFILQGELTISTRLPEETQTVRMGRNYRIAPGRPHLITNRFAVDCQFLLLQGVGAFDWMKAED